MSNADQNDSRSGQPGGDAVEARGPRKPRIEVLRPRQPAAAEAADAAPAAAPVASFGLVTPSERRQEALAAQAPAAGSSRPRQIEARADRRSGWLTGSRFALLSLLALLVIAAFLLYTYFGRDRGGSANEEAVRAENAEFVEDPLIDGSGPQASVPGEVAPAAPTQAEPEYREAIPAAPPAAVAPPAAGERPAPAPARTAAAARPAPAPARAAPARTGEVAPASVRQAPAAEPANSGRETSALTTARAFYVALSRGDGASAAQLVVPGKRQSGPLSAGALGRYYSSFRRPLQVRRFTPVDDNTVRVAYDYVLADGRLCRGEAAVDVVRSGDRRLVSGIRTKGPC